jgi:GTP cyclohydrolase II
MNSDVLELTWTEKADCMDQNQRTDTISAPIPIEAGDFVLAVHVDQQGLEHLAFSLGDIRGQRDLLVRVHSECLTGDLLGSRRCDCGMQLQHSLKLIGQAGQGLLIYLRQEGRGIGLVEKLRAYNLQDQGLDTVEANLQLGHPVDARDYAAAARILLELEIRSVRLLTNNPDKVDGLEKYGVAVSERINLQVAAHPSSSNYLRTKASRLNHQLDLSAL